MKTLDFSRYVLGIGLVVSMLAGCGGSQSVIDASGVNAMNPRPLRVEPLGGGGAFSGSYSGTYISVSDGLEFHGVGKASFLRRSSEEAVIRGLNHIPYYGGHATLTSSAHPQDTVTVRFYEHRYGGCGVQYPFSGKVTGGTGKFAKATGNVKVTFMCSGGSSGTYSDQWSGTLNF